MSNLTFQNYTDAVVAALQPLIVANGGIVKALKAYAGQIVVRPDAIYWDTTTGMPFVLVEVVHADYQPGGLPFHDQKVRLQLYVVTNSLRSVDDAYANMSTLLDSIRTLLLGQTLGLAIDPLLLVDERKMDAAPDMVFYLATYKFTNPRIAQAM